jgi:glycosyltransferase involved in cell wall biosynthesis
MKILQVLDSYPPDLNGGAYFIHRLSKQLVADGVDVLVICPSRSQNTHYDFYEDVKLYRVKSYPLFLYQGFRVSLPINIKAKIESAILEFKPDVIHLHGRFFLGKICGDIAKKYQIRTLATNHFMPENFFHYFYLPKMCKAFFSRLAWQWVKRFFEQSNVWTTPTQTAARLLKTNGFNRDIRVISCGVDTEKFYPRKQFKTKFANIPDLNIKTILYTGRIDKEKNLPVLLNAFSILRSKISCRLIITGSGSELRMIKKMVSRLNLDQSVIFTGRLTDEQYPEIFNLADCYCHAGTAELQSISTLEAVASGLPVVAANAMALPELVKHGVNGYCFEPSDFTSAAAHLYKILTDDDLAHRMSIESRQIASQHHIKNTGKAYREIYAELMNAA